MKNRIYIMQGRLSTPITEKIQEFPKYSYEQEFYNANLIDLDGIEWICDYSLMNPLLNFYSNSKIRHLIDKTNCNINTICMDFLEDSDELFNANSIRLLENYIDAINYLSDSNFKVIIPLFRKLSFVFLKKLDIVMSNLSLWTPMTKSNILFEIEDFEGYRKLDNYIYPMNYNICYDIGNRMLNAENIIDELIEFKSRIKHIHIKEKNSMGKSVPLGEGIIGIDGWENIFRVLRHINYTGDFTLQLARELCGNEISTVESQKRFIKGLLINV